MGVIGIRAIPPADGRSSARLWFSQPIRGVGLGIGPVPRVATPVVWAPFFLDGVFLVRLILWGQGGNNQNNNNVEKMTQMLTISKGKSKHKHDER